jgi:hypothetical protein
VSGPDLYLSQSVFLAMLAVSAAAGLGLGFFYDILILLRLLLRIPLPRHSAGARDVCDGAQTVSPSQAPRETGEVPRRMLSPTPGFAGDLLFMLIAAVTLILLVYYTNDGVLRAPALVGLTVGFSVWYGTVGRLLRRVALPLTRWIRRLFVSLMRILWCPIRRMAALSVRVLRSLWSCTAGKCLARGAARKTEQRLRKLTEEAQRGFDLRIPSREGADQAE